MRKEYLLKFMVVTMVACIMLAFLPCCSWTKKNQYYSQKENYINVTGTISNISYNEDSTGLYLEFSELSPVLDDICFKIVGENLQIVQANGIDSKLRIGEQINFITAPKYFGDGYVMPIVAISKDGDSLLGFEEGYTNLLNWLD